MSKKILIVEDEPTIAIAYSDFLSRAGYMVDVAHDGAEGIRKAKQNIPDLILLDIIMPVMDGFTMLEEMKKDPVTESIPVIVLSNLDSAESVSKMVEKGVMQYLVKADFSLESLEKKIKTFFVD